MNEKEPDKESNEGPRNITRRITIIDNRSLLQVDATVIIGVFFFLTISSFVEITQEEDSIFFGSLLTTLTVAPFGISAMLIIYSDSVFLGGPLALFHVFNKYLKNVTDERRTKIAWFALGVAKILTSAGFLYIIFTVGIIFILTLESTYGPSIAERCVEDPKKYGVNDSQLWQCSMFYEGSLAEECTLEAQRLGLNTSNCYRFIPSGNEEISVTS